MKTKSRFIKSVIATAQASEVEMPWTRGARRASFAANRRAKPTLLRARTA